MTNGEKFIEVFGDTTVLFDTDDNDTTIHQSGNWWDEEYKQSNSDEDCISRKEVCDYIAEFVNHEYSTDREHEMVEHIIGGIQHLPSIQPKPKTGHWILTDDDFVYCSECEDSYYPRPIDASWYYCPHCGCRMVEPQESEE